MDTIPHESAAIRIGCGHKVTGTGIALRKTEQLEARRGFNKDGDGLDTIKLLTLYSVKDREPLAFSKQPGNVPDVISLENALTQLKCLNLSKPLIVTDNGYYCHENMMRFAKRNMKFLTLVDTGVNWCREAIDSLRETLAGHRAGQGFIFLPKLNPNATG